MEKTALITGVTGQTGSYLASLLLDKGYKVHGLKRRTSLFNTERVDHLYQDPHLPEARLRLHHADMTDAANLIRIIQQVQPDEIYNLAAQSHVAVSFEQPEHAADGIGTLRLLEAIRILSRTKKTPFYQTRTSELYGLLQEVPQKETTPSYPRSPTPRSFALTPKRQSRWPSSCPVGTWTRGHASGPHSSLLICPARRAPARSTRLRNVEAPINNPSGLQNLWMDGSVKLDMPAKGIDFEFSCSSAQPTYFAGGAASQPVHDWLRRSWHKQAFIQFETCLHAGMAPVIVRVWGETSHISWSWLQPRLDFTASFETQALRTSREPPLHQTVGTCAATTSSCGSTSSSMSTKPLKRASLTRKLLQKPIENLTLQSGR